MQHSFDFIPANAEDEVKHLTPEDIYKYDDVIVAFSGGKDSIACVLMLLEIGIKPELWHHEVDGKAENFFDWPCTPAYVKAFADHLKLPLYNSWREGGLEGELLKENTRTKAVRYETPEGEKTSGGIRGKIATRKRWPAVSADLRTRWCSSVAKIDVFSAAICGQDRFHHKKVLVITGERAQESSARAKYKRVEPHRSNAPGKRIGRKVDHWRPILDWDEKQVWEIIEKHGIVPHPCYRMGISRASCMICIFSSAKQVRMIKEVDSERFKKVVKYENDFNHTIRSNISWSDLASKCNDSDRIDYDPEIMKIAMSHEYNDKIWTDKWTLPAGAYGESGGPS